jgi:hypothetical protein
MLRSFVFAGTSIAKVQMSGKQRRNDAETERELLGDNSCPNATLPA